MTEHPFLVLCGGDTAEADDLESAIVAARTLWSENWDALHVRIIRDDVGTSIPGEFFRV